MKTYASQLFDELNRKYWRGQLPRYRVIERASLPADRLGQCDNARRTILLAPHPSPEALRLTLLHEMCHIGTGPGSDHGPRFLRKLRRLVQLGETKLVEEDIEHYDGTAVERFLEARRAAGETVGEEPFRATISSALESMALSVPTRRWVTIERFLAKQYEVTPAQLQRACPWAKQEWRRLSAQIREEIRLRQTFEARTAHIAP